MTALAVDQVADDVFELVDMRSRWYSSGQASVLLFTRDPKS